MAGNSGQVERIPKRGQFPTSDSLDTGSANLRCAAALLAALFDAGVRHVVISSGTRCAPLVLAAGRHDGLRIWTNPDERSAGFFALGAAKASRLPTALICTSGTAAANYYPAVIEGRLSGVPLVVVTADRPPRLRGVGAPQTIDQVRLYGEYSVFFEDLSVPDGNPSCAQEWARSAQSAVLAAKSLGGPAHLNAPFDEPLLLPLEKADSALAEGRAAAKLVPKPRVESRAAETDLSELIGLLSRARRPVIVCGPLDDDAICDPILAFATHLGAPILADIASQVRRAPSAISSYDLFLREPKAITDLAPDLILRFGGLPTSKVLNEWIASSTAIAKIGIAAGIVADPLRSVTHAIQKDPSAALRTISVGLTGQPRTRADYRDLWTSVDAGARRAIDASWSSHSVFIEPDIVASACDMSGRDSLLFLSNSMPIRWADMYVRGGSHLPRVLVSRGANGIDGIISTAAGAAGSTGQTTVCILGDLTFLHDQNGLWKLKANQVTLKIVLLNNDGGGIFHFLPIASQIDQFEALVAMPHGIDMAHLAAAHGISHHRVDSRTAFESVFAESLKRPGPEVIEVRTDRGFNLRQHQETVKRVGEAVRELLEAAQ